MDPTDITPIITYGAALVGTGLFMYGAYQGVKLISKKLSDPLVKEANRHIRRIAGRPSSIDDTCSADSTGRYSSRF